MRRVEAALATVDVEQVIDALLAIDDQHLSDAELHASVVSLQRHISRLQAVQARRLMEWHNRKLWADDGSKAPGARLAREASLSKADADRLVKRARRLQSMPMTAAGFADGSLSSSQVDLMLAANQPNVTAAFVRDETTLVDAVTKLRFTDAAKAIRYWLQCADEAAAEDKATKQHERRTAFASRTFEGCVDLRALLDPVAGELFLNELERLERQLFEDDWREAKIAHGENVKVEHLKRTAAQRRCDAMTLMANRSAGAIPNPTKRPLISVLVNYDTFARVCELASGTVITPGMIVPLLADADVERIVFESPSRVIDVGCRQRFFRGALRRAIEVRDKHCQHPSGCDEPAAHCHVDHATAYANNGATTQDNGKLLCATHNRGKGAGPP